VSRFWQIFGVLHKRLDIYYAYLIATSTALQAGWGDFEHYVPPALRHWIVGTFTVIVAANHIVEAVRRVNRAEDGPEVPK
jgi:hypothetical protein